MSSHRSVSGPQSAMIHHVPNLTKCNPQTDCDHLKGVARHIKLSVSGRCGQKTGGNDLRLSSGGNGKDSENHANKSI